MFDGLTFLHYLHNILLDHSVSRISMGISWEPRRKPGLPQNRLEACNVLCLKAFRALLHLKFHRLTLVEGLVAIHLNGGKMHENIFAGLTLDEPVTLRSIEPLHCAL